MNGLFLNLPNRARIARRYNCSYNTPTFLLHPVELISLAAVFEDWHQGTPYLLDAIAENKTTSDVVRYIKQLNPAFIVTLPGIEHFGEDIAEVEKIKRAFPHIPVILFGHYVTEFYEEVMQKTTADYLLHGEPDLVFSELVAHLQNKKSITEVKGLSYRTSQTIVHQPGAGRIPNPNRLPVPAYHLLRIQHYSEPFFPTPYGIIQSARGCPYACNYCIQSYGTKLTALTPENILHHLKVQVQLFNLRSFRFIDDTFTATPGRVIEFCKLMVQEGYAHLQWSCFSRPDTLQPDMLHHMRKAGCKRLYIGIETGSQKMLDYYNKNVNAAQALANIQQARQMGFEIVGFFMVGAPHETEQDLHQSIQFAINARFDYATAFQFVAYPGTPIFKQVEQEVNFSLLPYQNQFINPGLQARAHAFQQRFFKGFYLRPAILKIIFKNITRHSFSETVKTGLSFLKYLYLSQRNGTRNDYI